ncbi:hypothetical protein BV25DRAFT_1829575 [Artomyces pyxidatus]|uniref:Uncharacterized protein n=1 Tax=Artomyces pyxidatus TaxID=48021 RepID=A0ACB8SRG0_9AGAM|nr:hypothetical protein BV25DRAFT_1829575 [Artomyces pyxidatus]
MSLTSLAHLLSRLDDSYGSFERAYAAYTDDARRGFQERADGQDVDTVKAAKEKIRHTLRDICDISREGTANGALVMQDVQTLLKKASEMENDVLNHVYGDNWGHLYNFIPVSCGNEVDDGSMGIKWSGIQELADLIANWPGKISGSTLEERKASVSGLTDLLYGEIGHPYDPASKPSSHSTPLARFSVNRPPLPHSLPSALRAFTEARCEIFSEDMPVPIHLRATDSVLAVLGAGGWKNRDPTLHLVNLDSIQCPDIFSDNILSIDVGLSDIARAIQLDSVRQQVYVGDADRVKSYQWTMDADQRITGSVPVHTLNTLGFSGPLGMKEGGTRLLRAGRMGLAVWDVERLPTHGVHGERVIGKELNREDLGSLRDNDDDEIELSAGTPPSQVVETSDLANIKHWGDHPNDPKKMIVTYENKYKLSCVDLETLHTVARYLGHGAYISDIQTNKDDPHSFITAANDGAVRLYDVRLPTPVLAISHNGEFINSALYEHIEGLPFIVIGGSDSQQIKVWDVRAKASLYELSTGNNEVNALSWDGPRQTLYSGTECQYVDRHGETFDYRRGKFPKPKPAITAYDEDEDMEDEDDSDYDSEDGEGNWPKHACHGEASFGYPLDSAGHRLYRYQFKADANPHVLPSSGYSRVDSDDYDW